jgi:hypothetical protein
MAQHGLSRSIIFSYNERKGSIAQLALTVEVFTRIYGDDEAPSG